MKAPALTDRVVRVRAYLSDEDFGYEHWRAAQFSAPETAKPAALLIFDTAEERDQFIAAKSGGASPARE